MEMGCQGARKWKEVGNRWSSIMICHNVLHFRNISDTHQKHHEDLGRGSYLIRKRTERTKLFGLLVSLNRRKILKINCWKVEDIILCSASFNTIMQMIQMSQRPNWPAFCSHTVTVLHFVVTPLDLVYGKELHNPWRWSHDVRYTETSRSVERSTQRSITEEQKPQNQHNGNLAPHSIFTIQTTRPTQCKTRLSPVLKPNTRVGTLIVATIYLQLIQNRYMFRSFTVLQCSHQHCVQPVASDVEVVGYL